MWGQKGLCSDSFKQQMALKTAWCTGRHREQDHHAAISLVGLGPDVATWLAYSSHSSWAGAGNQSGVHKPLCYEPHLATGFNRPDGTPAGETSFYSLHITVTTWMRPSHSCLLRYPRLTGTQSLKRFSRNGRMREKNSGECHCLHFTQHPNDPLITQTVVKALDPCGGLRCFYLDQVFYGSLCIYSTAFTWQLEFFVTSLIRICSYFWYLLNL